MPYRTIGAILVALALGGCYRVTVESGAAQAPTPILRPWQMSFAAGLIPPPEINTQADCPMGVAQVVTQRSFLNLVATAITSDIISPMDVRIVCAAGARQVRGPDAEPSPLEVSGDDSAPPEEMAGEAAGQR